MHKGLSRGFKMMKKPPEPGLPPPAPRPMSRSKPGTTPMKKDGPMSDTNQTIAQAVQEAEFSFLPESPKPFIPPQDQWPAEPPVVDRLRAHAPSRKAYKALRKV